jgi:hypothetical protein
MFSKLYDYYFWFTQPPTIFTHADKVFGDSFLACLILGIILAIAKRFVSNEVVKKLINKFSSWFLYLGITGLVWLGLRYENTPILAERLWAGVIVLIGIIWLIFILKYLVFNFRSDKIQLDRETVKNKYIPGKK